MREERNGRDGLVKDKADQSYHEEVGSIAIMRYCTSPSIKEASMLFCFLTLA